jgi:membrane protein DedA with SNARE-associated domain
MARLRAISERRLCWLWGVAAIALVPAVQAASLAVPAEVVKLSDGMSTGGIILALITATFISEDLTCIAAGLLIREGALESWVGIAGCTTGIFVGDLALWLAGRLAMVAAARWPWLAARLPQDRLMQAGEWFDSHGWSAILISRFIPGTRFVTYLGAGVVGRRLGRFMLWALLASLVWTPCLVLLSAAFGEAVTGPLAKVFGGGWRATAAALVLLLLVLRVFYILVSPFGWFRLQASFSRLWRWEFWPTWLFYLPIAPVVAALALRYRGVTVFAAANPGMRDGGFAGESKQDILERLPAEWTAPSVRLDGADVAARLAALDAAVKKQQWQWPVVLKPDIAERGAGFRVIRSRADAEAYLAATSEVLIAQRFHPGPHEIGVFYIRPPDAERGFIFAVTDKTYPEVTGDGRHSLAGLIWRHPRHRMQAELFLERFPDAADRVPADGETVRLAMAGNHSQGTLFTDGATFICPALSERIDEISQAVPGFCFGRYDLMYADRDALLAGDCFEIVELNGVGAEATNIYDPAGSLVGAYVTLARQWGWAYRIGAANIAAGRAEAPRLLPMLRRIIAFYRQRGAAARAD